MEMSTITEKSADVVVMGLGMMAGPACAELCLAGYNVVGIEKGPYLNYAVDFAESQKFDEWKTTFQHYFDHKLTMWTYSIRNNSNQFALPNRRTDKQTVPEGHEVGGMGVHYGTHLGRYMPWTYQAYSMTLSKYGASFLSNIEPNIDFEDYPTTYDDLVPYYQSWEQAYGTAGTNQEPFLPNSTFPVPPHPVTALGTLFQSTAEAQGYSPYPSPSGILSKPYTNQYGIARNECVYDGWCMTGCNFVCETGAKGSSHVATIPAAVATGKFKMVTSSVVFRINLNSAGTQATGVSYYDQVGNIHVQPASAVLVAGWSAPSIRMLLLSGVGPQYNPTTVTGTVGRGYSTSPSSSSSIGGTVSIGGNGYPCGNASGGAFTVSDFAGDSFDHTGLNFIGGSIIGPIGQYPGGGIGNLSLASAGPSNFGSAYKAGLKNSLLPTTQGVSISMSGDVLPQSTNYADLDPHYVDKFGDPIMRMTTDHDTNCLNASDYFAKLPAIETLLTKMGAQNVKVNSTPHASVAHYSRWSAHQRGGARIGANSTTSVFNQWVQSWNVPNVFSVGEHLMMLGDSDTPGTHGFAPYSYVAADGLKKYLMSPGPLVT
jgi:gluconate 2-dehydrogenase alpha chain